MARKNYDLDLKEGVGAMKKFLEEFKAFALKGNMIDLAVGVIIGAAFQSVVTSLTQDILMPLLQSILPGFEGEGLVLPLFNGQKLAYGAFVNAVIDFLIMAFVVFLLVKGMNKLTSLAVKKEEAPAKTKKCPYCLTDINVKATRCPNCTSVIEEVKKAEKSAKTVKA